jgi:hypothetical protein
MPANRPIRTFLLAILLLGTVACLSAPVAADTTTTTTGSVTVVDAGSLDVHWASDDVSFLSDGEAPAVTAVKGTEATATFSLVVDDTRAAENRAGYEIRLSVDPFTISGSDQVIPASSLAVTAIAGAPEGIDTSIAIGETLDGDVTVLAVPAGTTVDTTLDITVTMTIPAGTYPGTFTGGVTIEIQPVTS